MKSSISLDARIFDSGKAKNPPIAPPRKKRTTLKKGSTLPSSFISNSNDNSRDGFRDIFGKKSIDSASNLDGIDYIDKDDEHLSLSDQRTSTPEKKLRVGNKKSDNFFGESLSERLSDEPISPISKKEDELDDSAKSQTDKKLSFFLMNMLDDIRDANDQEKYDGMKPVEEPPFVARKRITKCICDDDEHMHMHFHGHDKDDEVIVGPPKPDRDFSKFKAAENQQSSAIEVNAIINSKESSPEKDSAGEEIQAKPRVKRLISRENLPSPPATPPHRKSTVYSTPNTPTITIDSIDHNKSQINNENKSNESREQSDVSSPQQITDLVDEMIKKAYGVSPDYHPEDMTHGHDDGTTLVTPTSKLAVRKISTPRKISTASTPSSIDGDTSSVKSVEHVAASPFKKTSFCEDPIKLSELLVESHRKFYEVDQAAPVSNPVPLESHEKVNKIESEKLLPVLIGGGTMNDIIDEIYSKNSEVMREFQSFLEESIEKEPVINVDEEKKFIENKGTLCDDEEMFSQKDIIEDDLDTRSYSDSFESTDTEQEVLKRCADKSNTNKNKIELNRRESIEDIDNWFSHHLELEDKESDVCNLRTGSDDPTARPTGYDTHKIFPFGSTITGRRDSLSDEFFTEATNALRMKPHIETVPESESSLSDEGGDAKEKDVNSRESSLGKEINSRESSLSKESSKSPDHSILLKFLDKTSTNDSAAIAAVENK